jgi:thioredoxin-like negative regulator of GroEL
VKIRLYVLAVLLCLPLHAETDPVWVKNWEEAFARAKAERKMVLVDFWASWCKPCIAMDRQVFPKPEVASRLGDFVLLKLDVDRSMGLVRRERVHQFPSYGFYDPWERQRFYFVGYQPVEDFTRNLDLIRGSVPMMVQAGQLLSQSDSGEAYLTLGNAYLRARVTDEAQRAYGKAKKIALKAGQVELAQIASIQSAFALAMEGKTAKALRQLETEGAKPASVACDAARLMAVGHIQKMKGDKTAAAAAFRQALVVCGNDALMKREAELALAGLNQP